MWLACYTIQKGARKWQRYHVNTRGGVTVKSDSFSGTTTASGTIRIDVSGRVPVGVNEIHAYVAIFTADANHVYLRFTTVSGNDLNVLQNTAVSGTYYYIET